MPQVVGKAADAVGVSGGAEVTGQAGEAPKKKPVVFKTGVLMRVPNVSPARDILDSGLKRASRVTPTKGLKEPTLRERNRSAKQLDALTTNLCKPLVGRCRLNR